MARDPRRGMPARRILLGALVLALALGTARAEELPTHAPLDPDGGVFVDKAGVARFLFTPEFRSAAWLEGTFVFTNRGWEAIAIRHMEVPRPDHADLELAPCDVQRLSR